MLGLLLFIIWLIPLVAFLLRNALCSELVKHIQKGNRLYQICAAICVVGIVAWGGVKPNMSMESNSTAQNINGTNINTLNSTIGANSSTSFTDAELASRLVFLDGDTNSNFVATPPENAVINPKWTMTGAAEDFVIVSPTNWAFPVNDKVYSNLFVSTTGNISFEKPITRTNAFTNQYTVLSPFRSVQSVLPYHLWSEIGNNAQSRFWYATTEYNSLLLTWENFLYLRNANYPISYQAELFKNGEFEFRYNLDSLPSNPTNAFIGYQVDNIANEYTSIATQTKTIKAQRLDSSIENNKDSDGDGISDADEIFIYGTDPTLADSDFDGMSDNQELLTGSNPLNPDEDGDGNRDYLTPELSNPEGIVVSTLREASAVFVFDTILPEGSYATLVINSTIIPLTSQSQIYLYFEGGRLYNYELHVPRNVIPNFSFLDADRLVNSTFSLRGADAEAQEASNEEEDKIMSEVQKVIYTIDDEPLKYNGNVGDASIEFVHLPGSTLFPIQSPCIHGNEEISVLLRTVPSEFLAKGEIIDVDNLVHEGNNIYTMAVDGIGYDNRNYGSITYRCPESNEEVTVYVNAHICESNANAYCYGCGVYHKNGTCPIHTGMCQVPYVVSTNCTCELELVEIKLCDVNANGVEDRYDDLASNIKTLKLIDNVEGCCCRDYAISEIRNVSLGNGLNNIETNQTADTINVVGRNHSGQIGYTTIDYDVYRSDGEKVNSITKKVIVLGLDLMFDYNDDGEINNDDKQLQYHHSVSNYYVSTSSEILPIKISAEIPPNLTTAFNSPNLNLFEDGNGTIPYEQATNLISGVHNIYYQSNLTNDTVTVNLSCSPYLNQSQTITFVDTTLTNMVAKVGDKLILPYYGSGITNRISIYELDSSTPCLTTDSDGEWIAGIPEGEYRMEVFYYDIYNDGVKGFFKDCNLTISDYNIIAGDYGLKCGTNNFLRINVFENPDIQFNITWKISPDESNGAKLSISEKSTKSNQIQTNASSIYVHAGIETNNYIITGWVDNKEIIASTNISVHVFPYEIDAPDQIVRSYSIKSAPISVSTTSEHTNHKWKLKKTYNGSGGNTELAKIGATTNSINKSSLNSSQVYFESHKADEKYDLTATHELYTNVTDTVEFRTCDIFFNPISCEVTNSTYIVNPRGFVYGDENYYKLELYPKTFLNNESNITWEGKYGILFQPYDDYYLSVKLVPPKKYDYSYTNTISIIIPDYYEEPPKFDVLIYPEYKTIKIQPIIIKRSQNEYINYEEDSIDPMNYNWSSRDAFRVNYTNQLSKGLSYSQKIFRQAGIRFEVDSTTELISPVNVFYDLIGNNTITNYNSSIYNGIKIYLVDSFENSYKGENAITSHTSGYPRICFGIIITKHTQTEAFPNEIGHMLGLDDIYELNNPNLADAIYEQNEITNDTTGVNNYYSKTRNQIIFSCVMYGCLYPGPQVNYAKILPLGSVFGSVNNDNHSPTASINVGLRGINTNVVSYGELIQ